MSGTSMTIPGLVHEAAIEHGDRPAVVDGERRITYDELAELTRRAAGAFLAGGIEPGSRVAIWAPNRWEFIVALLGAASAGIVVVPMNSRYRGAEALQVLSHSRAQGLVLANSFLDSDYLGQLRAAAAADPATEVTGDGTVVPGLPSLRVVVDLDARTDDEEVLSWEGFLDRQVPKEKTDSAIAAVGPDDLCDLMFTSGTTGVPKGVMSAHRQTVDCARIWARGAELTDQDRYAVINPFFHGFGYKAGMLSAIAVGATTYPVPIFDTGAVLDLVAREEISVLPGAPTIFTSLMNDPGLGSYDLSSLRFAVAGAASVPESLFVRMRDVLGFETVAQAYGLTECIMVTQTRPGEDPRHVAQVAGQPVEGIELKIVDTAGNEQPQGEDGEILIRGRNVMLGYFEDEEATRKAIDEDRWFHSGDVGHLDEHGCLKITDRLTDMFIVGGFNVYPAEVENVIAGHDAVSEVAVIGIPDERLGTIARAYVVARHGVTVDEQELIQHCRQRLANFKVPRSVVWMRALPKNASGKIRKGDIPASGGKTA